MMIHQSKVNQLRGVVGVELSSCFSWTKLETSQNRNHPAGVDFPVVPVEACSRAN